MYNNIVFKQTLDREDFFHSISQPSLFIMIQGTVDIDGLEAQVGTLYQDYSMSNIVERNIVLLIVDDVRDLISSDTIDDWIISVRQSEDVWHMRDIYLHEGFADGDGYCEPDFLAINLTDTPFGNMFEESNSVDIYDIKNYALYHKEKGNYYLVTNSFLLRSANDNKENLK